MLAAPLPAVPGRRPRNGMRGRHRGPGGAAACGHRGERGGENEKSRAND